MIAKIWALFVGLPPTYRTFFRIAGELDDLPTPYKFDVIDYKNLSHEGMKNSIDRDGIVFYKREIL